MCYDPAKTRATDMLEKIAILVLLCVIGILVTFLQVERRKLRDARRENASLRLAVDHWEREAHRC
jgi:hypothetical protein